MRRPPSWTEFTEYPVVAGTIALAVAVSVASWSGRVDVSPLYETIDIRRGELWCLLTSSLPHANILHLVFNVYWTWVFGTAIEKAYGPLRTFAIFVFLSVVANGTEYAILSGGIGLSGIGYGLFGLLWVLSRRDPEFEGFVDRGTVGVFVGWFFVCIVITLAGEPIANIAHGMGAAAGALLGWLITTPSKRVVLSATSAGLLVGVLAAATVGRPWVNLSPHGGDEEGKLAYEALMAGRDAEALRSSRDATRMQPRVAGYWENMGIALDRLHRHAEAMAAYRRAHALEPNNPEFQIAG